MSNDTIGGLPWGDFVIPARDLKGQTSTLSFGVQPGHRRQAQVFIGTRRFPYRTIGDLLRHAFKRHMEWMETVEPETVSILAKVDNIITVARDEQFDSEQESVFDAMSAMTQKYIDRGDLNDARRMLARMMATIQSFPDEGWRGRYSARFLSQFGSHLSLEMTASPALLNAASRQNGSGTVLSFPEGDSLEDES